MKKARLIRFVLLIFFASIIFISGSAVLIFHYFPKGKILTIITSSGEKILNRKLLIRGIDYGLKGITLKDISIYNKLYSDNNFPESDLLAFVKNASIHFSILQLLKKEFVIDRIVLNNLKIIISYDKGKSNLDIFLQDFKANRASGIEAKVSSVRFRDAEITIKDPPELLKPMEGRYFFNGTVNISSNNSVSIKDCEIILPGDRGLIQSDNTAISLFKDNFEIKGSYKLQNCSLLWLYEWNKEYPLPFTNFTGRINNLKVTKELVEVYAKGKSKLRNGSIAAADGLCRVDLKKETASLLDIKGEMQNSKFFINEIKLTYSNKIKETLLKFNISEIKTNGDDLKALLSFLPFKVLNNIYGEVSGNLSYDKSLFSGDLDLRNVVYRRDGKDIIRINSDITINNNIIYKEKISAFIYGQPCQISISTSGDNFQKIILNLYAGEFNYSTDKEDPAGNPVSSLKIKQEISGRVEVDDLKAGKFNFSNVAVNYSLKGGRLNLDHVGTKFMGGNIKGSGGIDVSEERPYVKLSTTFEDIKVQNLTNLNKELAGRFFGIAKGNAEMEFEIDNDSDIYNSLKGKIELNIDKGKFVNTGVQKGLGIMLSELKYKLKDLEFNKIYGNFSVIGSNFNINSLVFNAPDIRLKIDGYFSKPLKEETKMPGDIKIILEYNDFFIQDIPNLPQAQFLKVPGLTLKKKGDWYNMSFRDRGDDITDSKNIKPL